MLGKRVVVLGGTGFVGRAVVNELSKNGYHTQVAVRRPERYREFALYSNTQLAILDSYQDVDELKAFFENADIVINLISDLTAGLEAIQVGELVNITQQIKKAVEIAGVQRVVTLSQMGADPNNAENKWLCELGEADAILMALANVPITVMRPSLILGDKDDLTMAWSKQLKVSAILPVANGSTQVQPIAVEDFAKALVMTVSNTDTYGQKVEVAGEERLSLKDLADLVTALMEKDNAVVFSMCDLNAKFMTFLGPLAPFKSVTQNQMLTLRTDMVSESDFATRFGFVPKSLEQTLVGYVIPNGMRARYHYYRQEAGRNSSELMQ